jgi:hypothetical protein
VAREDSAVTGQGPESVELVVKLSPDAAVGDSAVRRALQARASELGVALAPLHPSTSDPELAAYAVARVDPAVVDDVIGRLSRFEGVEAAYAKAPGAPPERRARDGQQP